MIIFYFRAGRRSAFKKTDFFYRLVSVPQMITKLVKLAVAKATLSATTKYAGVGLYFIVLVLLLGFLGQQIFARVRGEPLNFIAEISPGSVIRWQAGSKEIVSGVQVASDYPDTQITANNFTVYVWNDAMLSLVLFATPEASMKCHDQNPKDEQKHDGVGNSVICEPYLHPNLRSDTMTIQSEVTASLKLEADRSFGAISFTGRRNWISLVYYRRYRNDTEAANAERNSLIWTKQFRVFGEISGPDGSPFTVTAYGSNSKVTCKGTFQKFVGSIFRMGDATQWRGEGAVGVMGLKLQSAPGDIKALAGKFFSRDDAKLVQAINVVAWKNSTISFDLPVKWVNLTGLNATQFMYPGVLNPIVDESRLLIWFDENTPGKFIIDGGKQTVMIKGSVDHIQLNEKNITRRRIDEWPWYAQTLFGTLIGIVAKQLYTSWHKIRHANQSLNSDVPDPRVS